jgi:hypothetical protein
VGGWCSKAVTGPYGMSLWKHIRRAAVPSLVLLLLWWVMAFRPGFGMTLGVGIIL